LVEEVHVVDVVTVTEHALWENVNVFIYVALIDKSRATFKLGSKSNVLTYCRQSMDVS